MNTAYLIARLTDRYYKYRYGRIKKHKFHIGQYVTIKNKPIDWFVKTDYDGTCFVNCMVLLRLHPAKIYNTLDGSSTKYLIRIDDNILIFSEHWLMPAPSSLATFFERHK